MDLVVREGGDDGSEDRSIRIAFQAAATLQRGTSLSDHHASDHFHEAGVRAGIH